MIITATEFKSNIGKYLDTISYEDIYVTRRGKMIAKIISPGCNKQAILDNLAGIAKDNPITLEEARAERLSRK
jgi:antitoxin (DNA-binding transcriptional repressor) of toxin-antitoxin stability system